jgi:hypothetical protein
MPSTVNLTLGSLTTGTEQRYIMENASSDGYPDYPVSGPGVESDYHIMVTGFGEGTRRGE